MKIALLISGHMRSRALDLASLSPHKPDVYLHTWTTVDADDAAPVLVSDVLERYPARAHQIEVANSAEVNGITRELTTYLAGRQHAQAPDKIDRMVSRMRNVYKVGQLVENWADYDLVIWTRPDMAVTADIVSVANSGDYYVKWQEGQADESIVPEIVVGSSVQLRHWCSLYPSLPALLARAKDNDQPERVLNDHTTCYWWMKDAGYSYRCLPQEAVRGPVRLPKPSG